LSERFDLALKRCDHARVIIRLQLTPAAQALEIVLRREFEWYLGVSVPAAEEYRIPLRLEPLLELLQEQALVVVDVLPRSLGLDSPVLDVPPAVLVPYPAVARHAVLV